MLKWRSYPIPTSPLDHPLRAENGCPVRFVEKLADGGGVFSRRFWEKQPRAKHVAACRGSAGCRFEADHLFNEGLVLVCPMNKKSEREECTPQLRPDARHDLYGFRVALFFDFVQWVDTTRNL